MLSRAVAAVLGIALAACVASQSPVEIRRQQATQAQQPYFVDGVIDAAEYRRAVEATVACVKARGIQLSAELADDGYYQYAGPATSGLDAALDICRKEHSQQVELAYQEMQGPTEDEMPAVLSTIQCLRDAGHPPTSGTRPDQLREFIASLPPDDAARACRHGLPDQ